jgi:hypothetical protein
VARTRTTKKLAQRIDLNYFKRPTPLKRAKFWLGVLLPLLALIWISWRGYSGDHRVYSSGRLSAPHAILEKECDACHLQNAGTLSAKAADSACLGCHDGPIHHELGLVGKKELACAECHAEHRGRVNLNATNNQSCAICHADLHAAFGAPMFAAHIRSFEDGHPEFAALRSGSLHSLIVHGHVRLNHAIHMKLIRRGPTGPTVQLDCADCHRPPTFAPPSTYSDASYVSATVGYSGGGGLLPGGAATTLPPRHPITGRELMAPVKFANACSGCHSLTFDKRFDSGVPHDKPEVVRAFVVKKFREYIAEHPNELRETRDPNRGLTGKPLSPEVRVLTPAQWVAERSADAEELLWRKTCAQCHALSFRYEGDPDKLPRFPPWLRSPNDNRFEQKPLPEIMVAQEASRLMPHAKFDHGAHEGFTCVSCHAKALTSTEASDVLLPGIATCKTCHAPGPEHAESRCFECHTYHDWSKRKEITPKFTLPALPVGGH